MAEDGETIYNRSATFDITTLTNGQLDGLTTAQRNYIATILALAQIQLLANAQLDNLSNIQLDGIVPQLVLQHIQALENGQLANLTTAQKNHITTLLIAAQVQLLSNGQLATLAIPQLNYITTLLGCTQVILLNSTQLDCLTATQLDSVIGQLFSQHIVALNESQVNFLTIVQRNKLSSIHPTQTGCTSSQKTNDDGNLQLGRLTNFSTLKTVNSFGNLSRFTDEHGGQTYNSPYLIDHATGLGWRVGIDVNCQGVDYDDALLVINSYVLSCDNDDFEEWRIPNINELLSLRNYSISTNSGVGMDIIGNTGNIASSTVVAGDASKVLYIANNGKIDSVLYISGDMNYAMCRTHF